MRLRVLVVASINATESVSVASINATESVSGD